MISADKIRRFVLPNLPYALLFWVFAKCGEAYRIAPGRDTLQKLMSAVSMLEAVFATPMLRFELFDLTVGVVGAAAVYLIVLYKKKNAKKWRKDVEYGSARWGGKKDIEPYVDKKPENNIILTASESLTMNSRPSSPKHARNKNVMIVGGSGSGKTRFWLKPNLMQCESKSHPVSFVVTDPKGSVAIECGKLLQRNGYEIKVLNTIDFSKSMRYNPFAYIRSEKDILKFVTALIENTKGEDSKGGDDFWQKAEVLLYCALIGYIHYEGPEEEQNMNSLVEMINAMETREDDENFKNAVDYMFDDMENGVPVLDSAGNPVLSDNGEPVWETPPQPQHFAVRQYRRFKLAAGKTAKSILISCGARLAPFDIAELRQIMSYDEMELDMLGDKKTALFVIVSDTDSTFNFVAALLYSQLFNLLCDRADNVYGGRLPVHVRLLLDEFANIGKIPQFDKLIATIRSREISACVILQTQSQLKHLYKEAAETIIGNIDSRLFLGGSEKTTLKDLTESLGKETIDILNHSVSKGNSPSFSQSYQKLGKDLMSVDELSVMDGSKCILQLRGVRPFFSDKYDITKHKNYKYLSDANPKNAFDIGKYISTRLRVKPDEQYEFMEYTPSDEEMPEEVYEDFPIDLEPV
ncbi:type IV secretory system conjugative DNA transfer family protein [Ruminococcaceae bacterium OttesenSCG-928-L11]|nr:type IV secretory system conjugative DNA transfer family protein [Ruminococcaceae bacterium OttesenSCG-928-L11]